MPFRDAHEVVGKAVRLAIDTDRKLDQLDFADYRALSGIIEQDVYSVLTVEGSVAARKHFGGTAPDRVRDAAATARAELRGQ